MAKSRIYRELRVCIPGREYPILIGTDLLNDLALLRDNIRSRQLLIVTNTCIAPLYLKPLQDAFADRQCDTLVLEDGEAFKTKESLFAIFECLIEGKHHRDTTLIALGGGVIGDLTGFAASTYQRGVRFVQIPTTLLAQVDSSVGGKTAINLPGAKNMIGSFYQPDAVLMDLNTLKTLPERELRAGLAEVIKYALLYGGIFLNLVEKLLSQGIEQEDSEGLAELIYQSCRIKAEYVELDERESGLRALLNLGHTVGHALEAYTDYNRWLHGEAVAIGLYCAALLSNAMGILDSRMLAQIDSLLSSAKLPRRIPRDIDLTRLRTLMSQDKKVKDKRLRFILIRAAGDCYIEDNVSEDTLVSVLRCAVEGEE